MKVSLAYVVVAILALCVVFSEFKDYVKIRRTNANIKYNGTKAEILKIKPEPVRNLRTTKEPSF